MQLKNRVHYIWKVRSRSEMMVSLTTWKLVYNLLQSFEIIAKRSSVLPASIYYQKQSGLRWDRNEFPILLMQGETLLCVSKFFCFLILHWSNIVNAQKVKTSMQVRFLSSYRTQNNTLRRCPHPIPQNMLLYVARETMQTWLRLLRWEDYSGLSG